MSLKTSFVLAAILTLCLAAGDAHAGCTFSSSTLVFGNYDVFSPTPVDSVGTLTYDCSGTPTPVITLTAGNSGTYAQRWLLSGANALVYNLYLDAARMLVWGDGTGGTSSYSGTVGATANVSVYGRIPAAQGTARAGVYTDSIIATINF
jgi:spore coat protein U-like protein